MKKINVLGISLLMMVSLLSACGDKKTTISYEIKGNQVGDISINGKYTDTEAKVIQEEVSGKEIISQYQLTTKQPKDSQDQIKDPEYKVTLTVDRDGKVSFVQVNDKEIKDKTLENGSSFTVEVSKDKDSYQVETKIGQTKAEKEALEKAKKTLEMLEKEKTQENVNKALEACKVIPELNKKYKKEVADKIKVIYEGMLEDEAEKAVKMAEEKKSQSDIDLALKRIKKLPEDKQATYQKRVETIQEELNQKTTTSKTSIGQSNSSSSKKASSYSNNNHSSSKGKSTNKGSTSSKGKTQPTKKPSTSKNTCPYKNYDADGNCETHKHVCYSGQYVYQKYREWSRKHEHLGNFTGGDSDFDGCHVIFTNDGQFRYGED